MFSYSDENASLHLQMLLVLVWYKVDEFIVIVIVYCSKTKLICQKLKLVWSVMFSIINDSVSILKIIEFQHRQ